MQPIRKKIVADESMQPVAVQIEYRDWLEIERLLGLKSVDVPQTNGASPPKQVDLNKLAGSLTLREDPLVFQRRVRGEWA